MGKFFMFVIELEKLLLSQSTARYDVCEHKRNDHA